MSLDSKIKEGLRELQLAGELSERSRSEFADPLSWMPEREKKELALTLADILRKHGKKELAKRLRMSVNYKKRHYGARPEPRHREDDKNGELNVLRTPQDFEHYGMKPPRISFDS
ncbi:MAG TPA: hypothetical protein VGQ87_03500 [Patescibacteria group bacterium]|nr:hypothetical protein [Patescibacteria group bacterium]